MLASDQCAGAVLNEVDRAVVIRKVIRYDMVIPAKVQNDPYLGHAYEGMLQDDLRAHVIAQRAGVWRRARLRKVVLCLVFNAFSVRGYGIKEKSKKERDRDKGPSPRSRGTARPKQSSVPAEPAGSEGVPRWPSDVPTHRRPALEESVSVSHGVQTRDCARDAARLSGHGESPMLTLQELTR